MSTYASGINTETLLEERTPARVRAAYVWEYVYVWETIKVGWWWRTLQATVREPRLMVL